MIKLNNKGQSLVMFILILPILLSMLILVIDVGNIIIAKQELDNVNYLAIEYGLEHLDQSNLENKLISMLNLNNNKLNEITVLVEDNKIKITTKRNINGILIRGLKIFNIESDYEGYIENGEKIIERV